MTRGLEVAGKCQTASIPVWDFGFCQINHESTTGGLNAEERRRHERTVRPSMELWTVEECVKVWKNRRLRCCSERAGLLKLLSSELNKSTTLAAVLSARNVQQTISSLHLHSNVHRKKKNETF